MRVVVHVRHQIAGLACPKIVDFRIDATLPLKKVMSKWCTLAQVKMGMYAFKHGTTVVNSDDTPCELEWGSSVFVDVTSATGASEAVPEDDSGLNLPRLCYTLTEEPESPNLDIAQKANVVVPVPPAPAPAIVPDPSTQATSSQSAPSALESGISRRKNPARTEDKRTRKTDNPAALPRKRKTGDADEAPSPKRARGDVDHVEASVDEAEPACAAVDVEAEVTVAPDGAEVVAEKRKDSSKFVRGEKEDGPSARVRELMEELDGEKPWNAFAELETFDMTLEILAMTGVGKKITALEKSCWDSYVKRRCHHMLKRWRQLLKRDAAPNKSAPAKESQASMNSDAARQKLPERLIEGGLSKKVAQEVEEGLYQLAEQQAEIEGVRRKPRTLPPAYKDLVRRVLTSLRENAELYSGIGVRFRASRLGEMPAHWLLPRERQLQREQYKKENLKQVCNANIASSTALDLGVSTQDYECPKCASTDCAYKSDNRGWHKSSGDTMTLLCRQCNHRWHKE